MPVREFHISLRARKYSLNLLLHSRHARPAAQYATSCCVLCVFPHSIFSRSSAFAAERLCAWMLILLIVRVFCFNKRAEEKSNINMNIAGHNKLVSGAHVAHGGLAALLATLAMLLFRWWRHWWTHTHTTTGLAVHALIYSYEICYHCSIQTCSL